MIVTIDGPAGAGKSSAARELARRLGFIFLDTGAMYRAVTWAALEAGVTLANEAELARIAHSIDIKLNGSRVAIDGKDVTDAIRTFRITTATHFAADHPGVRERLVQLQREIAEGANIVTEGRDQATVVFPHAECKIFLTADERIRAQRRHEDMQRRGEQVSLDEVLAKQRVRDQRDQTRPVGALRKSGDAIEVHTDGMTPEEVVNRLEEIVRARQKGE